jgi:hypothetical protein
MVISMNDYRKLKTVDLTPSYQQRSETGPALQLAVSGGHRPRQYWSAELPETWTEREKAAFLSTTYALATQI